MNRKKQLGQSGFTLFELLIVMAIAALAIGTALTFYNPGRSTADIKSKAFSIASEIARVRNKAIIRQTETLVSFDLSERKITFGTKQRVQTLKKNFDISVTSAALENRSSAVSGIRFFPDGSSTGGTVLLKQGNETYEIRISWLTGHVSTRKIGNREKQP